MKLPEPDTTEITKVFREIPSDGVDDDKFVEWAGRLRCAIIDGQRRYALAVLRSGDVAGMTSWAKAALESVVNPNEMHDRLWYRHTALKLAEKWQRWQGTIDELDQEIMRETRKTAADQRAP